MAATFNPTQAELALTQQIFAVADPKKLGALTGEVAVKVFGGANLSPTVLGQIWQIADESNNGWLSQKGVAIAVRLLGHAQKGEKVSEALLSKPGPLPTITGVTPVLAQGTGASNSSLSRAKSPQPGMPPFTPQDKNKFQAMFAKAGPGPDGLLSSDKAQEVFVRSKLSNETLGLIWNLADTQDRGQLDSTDFAIGMYFIQATMTGQITSIPNTLPPGLYQQVAGPTGSLRTQATGGSYSPLASSFSQATQSRSNIQPQYTGTSALQPQVTGPWSSKPPVPPHLPARPGLSAVSPSPSSMGSGAFGAAPAWDITPAEKTNSDRWFDSLDTQHRGFIQDDVAVPFMLESKLSGDDLAQIWDLADVNNDGKLTRDGFAIAWHLIQKKRNGAPIPATLPPSLVPPSMRAAAGASPFASAPAPAPPEPAKDLFSWDDPVPSPAPVSTPSAQRPLSPQNTAFSTPPRAIADPFGSSSFAPPPAPAAHHDLLGDDDDTGAASPPMQEDKSAEIGNLQNQVNSTSRSLATAQADRAALEATLANQAAQLSALETQLTTAKAAYDTETKLLAGLRERHATQTADITKTREELIRAESDLSAVRVEKAEIEGAFLRDKEEVRALQRRMVETGQEVEMAKMEVEKSKKEAKQQKGLLAIARKQLSTKEAERAKVEKELAEARAEAASIVTEKEEVESSIAALDAQPIPTLPVTTTAAPLPERTTSNDSLTFAAAQALPATPDVASPSIASSIKSNNPFDRLMGNSTPRSQSPFAPSLSPQATGTSSAAAPDPFGFSQAFETDATAPVAEVAEPEAAPAPALEEERKSPTPKPAELTPAPIISTDNESDIFSTPLTGTGPTFPTIDNIVETQFPPVETVSPNPPGHFEPEPALDRAETTDLGAQLKEIDVGDSDSSDDSDSEDEVPLATLQKEKQAEVVEAAETPTAKPNGHDAAKPAEEPSFDDIFGVANPTPSAPPAAKAEPGTDAFGMPLMSSMGGSVNGFMATPEPPAVAGVNAFDEALGKIPAASSPAPQFSAFDAAFDDNFDFGTASAAAATATSFPPAPTAFSPAPTSAFPLSPTGAVNGHATPTANKNEFDSIFGASPAAPATLTEPPKPVNGNSSNIPNFEASQAASPAPQNGNAAGAPEDASTSFDEAFASFSTGPDLKNLATSLDSPTSATAPVAPSQSFPSVSPTSSPRSVVSSSRKPTTERSVSPPPRHRSPPPQKEKASKGRPSTGSSKDEKVKDTPPTRSSKLSIRLPFGKKKKQTEPLPAGPSHLLTPPREEPDRTTTPAVDDDVEAVKQLTAMGFSRTQAVDALEASGYDVQKALNGLLNLNAQ
ncbi:hypothetical protein R3P38DRAFT_1076930 [Favolaschia claudopus]|uniref:Uncharacterized protein n=1 Tax=Favolaschia claudopus TaxID=2862362 RepID=A0AAW0BER8_9AGAR